MAEAKRTSWLQCRVSSLPPGLCSCKALPVQWEGVWAHKGVDIAACSCLNAQAGTGLISANCFAERVKDSLYPCCKDTPVLSLVKGKRSGMTQLESTKGICQGLDPVPTQARKAFISYCVQSEQREPGGLGSPNLPSRSAPDRRRSGASAILQLSRDRWAPEPFSVSEEHQPLLSPRHQLCSRTYSTSTSITASSQNLFVCA